jgi:carboxylate-amine ligase
LKDASYLWWAIRPALNYPTLELRICDACTRIEDALAIAALYRCLVRLLIRRPELAPDWSPHTRRIIDENRWRAKRLGIDAELVSEDGSPPRPLKAVTHALLEDVAEDSLFFGCDSELSRIRALLDEGTSAHAQVKVYQEARARGESLAKAIRSVVDWLIAASVPGDK